MKRYYYMILCATAIMAAACSKVHENDVPAPRVYPDGMTFHAMMGTSSKSTFVNPEESVDGVYPLAWSEDDDVAIIAIPVNAEDEYDWDHVVSGLASVEIDASDSQKAILHTSKKLSAWVGNAARVEFRAVYPARGKELELYKIDELDDPLIMVQIPHEQDGVNFGHYQVMGSITGKLKVETLTEGSAVFHAFDAGSSLISFKMKSSTGSDLSVKRIRMTLTNVVSDVRPNPDYMDQVLSGDHALFFGDNSAEMVETPYISSQIGRNVTENTDYASYNYVDVVFPQAVTVGATLSSTRYYICVQPQGDCIGNTSVLFQAMDENGNVIAEAEKDTPNGGEFASGHRYNFALDLKPVSDYHFVVHRQPGIASVDGGTIVGSVRSYKENGDGTRSYVPWTMEGAYMDAECTVPADPVKYMGWLESWNANVPGAGESVAEAATASVTVKANPNLWTPVEYDCVAEIKQALSQVTPRGSASAYYNLSNASGSAEIENTANCYVINGPGYYMFPCVLGNGIKGGAENPGAWQASDNTSSGQVLRTLVDYTGNPISSPYVQSSSSAAGTPASVALLWQDTSGLIKTSGEGALSLAAADGNYWVKFQVDASTIAQGNAVIAVKDQDGTIMWSWHIWVTDRKFDGTEDVDVDGVGFSKVNLGWVETKRVTGWNKEENLVYIKIQQYEDDGNGGQIPVGKSAVVKLRQSGDTMSAEDAPLSDGYNPLFQYGRKDPLVPGIPSYTIAAGTDVVSGLTFDSTEGRSINYAIQHPMTMTMTTTDRFMVNCFADPLYVNLWNTLGISEGGDETSSFADEAQRKSVYDPCPVGYQVPQAWDIRRFDYETVSREYISTGDDEGYDFFSTTYSFDNSVIKMFYEKGAYLYADDSKSSSLFLPFTGTRTVSGMGALWAFFDEKGDLSYLPYLAFGHTNRISDDQADSWMLFLFQIGANGELDTTGSKYAFLSNQRRNYFRKRMPYPLAGDAGFIRPVKDRSTPVPLNGDLGNAGEYTDKTW